MAFAGYQLSASPQETAANLCGIMFSSLFVEWSDLMQEVLMQILTWVSLFVGIGSLVIAFYTIWLAHLTGKESREQYDKTKDLLNEIDKPAQKTETVINTSQQQMLETFNKIINELVIPKKADQGEQFATMMMQMMAQDPKKANQTMESLAKLAVMAQQMKPPGK